MTNDRFEQLLARYAHAFGALDDDAWVACFASDGIWEVWEPGDLQPGIHVEGEGALRAWVVPYFDTRRKASLVGRHVQDSVLVDEKGDDRVRLRVQFHTLVGHEGRWRVNRAGYFDDEVARDASGMWRFARRSMHCDG